MGAGYQNTIDIVTGCPVAGIAADICANLTLNGYSDWFLPSYEELYEMYLNKAAIGGFATNYYWSSSEFSTNFAWALNISGHFEYGTKGNSMGVRAIRAF